MILSKTPFRISFLGGGTDFPEFFEEHGGAVLGTAINKFVYHSVIPFESRLFDYSIRLAYRKVECVSGLEEIRHAPCREVMRKLGIHKDVEINITADLPAFSGVGSSSSFVVGLLNALMAHKGVTIPRLDLAYQAIHIERDILKESVGCQDQVFGAVGGFNLIEFFKTDNIVVHRVPMTQERLNQLDQSLMMFFTGIRRRANDIEENKIRNIQFIKPYLLSMRKLVDQGYTILTSTQPLETFGELLHKTWVLKKRLDSGVSNQTVDAMYEMAVNAGALGGKVCGAGGGGFLMLYVPPDRQLSVRNALKDFHQVSVTCRADGTQIVHS